ncbi:SNF2-related protein [Candidatus Moduliflexus flocculans]|uniref:SNF2-related protein n=1 Tax=Candidatus Moduliflexus flocculans TaxID=1499966 RepID=A0A081BPW2_9BACT|nr:SNF2-related protein [Candidatus Moduliflexus flocculans]
MIYTDYQAKYIAHELTKRHAVGDLEKLAGALVDARVDLNPHQVDAALFAFRSPLSKGAILADEVGLGKTIEAGLVISQRWAERKRRMLVITPANLRKQWLQELQDKFFLPCRILETASYNRLRKADAKRNPFDANDPAEIVICSYQFARAKARDVGGVPWHLVVIDEAHRLRNVYKKSNKIANDLRDALKDVHHKLLLTATPLQNSLLELYGLVSFIDEHVFGDLNSFRGQFSDLSRTETFQALKARLQPICKRTLRSQVLPYIKYTKRQAMTHPFTPSDDEWLLYTLVSEYLRKPNLVALPASQRQLITLVLRKLLASSTFAIAGALETMLRRLRQKLEQASEPETSLGEELGDDYEELDEMADEWSDDEDEPETMTDAERASLAKEVAELQALCDLAKEIGENAKGGALLKALETAFAKAAELGAAQKALIFTESRRTQDYLLRLLADSPYRDGIVLFNGTNNDDRSKAIYKEWAERHSGTDRVSGSRAADMRSALVDEFRERGQIMIATEAGAEGINLQFCALVVNYDLPWNPQRVEQRIGRCHRYGQQHDVVVVNFLNQKNEADRRVFELLDEKFQLFKGVFGSSDEVLGIVESGVAFEKRIAEIYQHCRAPEEINSAFDALQAELSAQIQDAMTQTRQSLLEHFDDEVREKLRVQAQNAQAQLDRCERLLMELTRYELDSHATFHDAAAFDLHDSPFICAEIPAGRYELPRRSGEAYFYRMAHPLAQQLLTQAKQRALPPVEMVMDYTHAESNISVLEQLPVKQGWLRLSRLRVESLSQPEDALIWAAVCDDGQILEEDIARRMFELPAQAGDPVSDAPAMLATQTEIRQNAILRAINERNADFFDAEIRKLDAWAEDRKASLEQEIKDYDRRIKEARRAAQTAISLEEKLAAQKEVNALEKERSDKRRTLFAAQDEIDANRDNIIANTEALMTQAYDLAELLCVRWRLV